MVLNFLRGGAGINVFCKANHIDLKIVDAGVNFNFPKNSELIDAKIAGSTADIFDIDVACGDVFQLRIPPVRENPPIMKL